MMIDDWINSRKQQLHKGERADPTKEMLSELIMQS
jgi:hypothetical protein